MAQPGQMGGPLGATGGDAVLNRDEVCRCLKTLKLTYPGAYSRLSAADAEEMISVWMRMFADDSFDDVNRAITSLIKNGTKFVPTAGEIKAEMEKLSPQSTWALNRRPYPQSFIDAVHSFLAEEEAAGRYQRQALPE